MRRTNSNSLRSCLCFQVFRVSFASDFLNLLLVRFHHVAIIIVKHLIQRCSNDFFVLFFPLARTAKPNRNEHKATIGDEAVI